jgi:hypothetical protein
MLEPKIPLINNLAVRGVKHIQDNQLGTRTEVTCALSASFGGDKLLQAGNAPFGGGTTIATNAPGRTGNCAIGRRLIRTGGGN